MDSLRASVLRTELRTMSRTSTLLEPATATVSNAADAPEVQETKPYVTHRPLAPDPAKPECPIALCPEHGHCPYPNGTCCQNSLRCCPSNHLCKDGGAKCVKNSSPNGMCLTQKCKKDHKCPHPGVTECCLEGITCCKAEYTCGSKRNMCILKPEFRTSGSDDTGAATVQGDTSILESGQTFQVKVGLVSPILMRSTPCLSGHTASSCWGLFR